MGLLAVSIVLMITGLSCSSDNKTSVMLQNEFTLVVGQTANVEGESLSLKFVKVEEDNRCPKDAECIQAGQVTCKVHVNHQGATSDISITQKGGSFISAGTLGNYNIVYRVEPYPEAGQEIAEADYKLIMTVTKASD
jgi:hypothetical protein